MLDFVKSAFIKGHFFKYNLFRTFGWPKCKPVSMTFSVTFKCNSRCAQCGVWKKYLKEPQLINKELKLSEFENIFNSIGSGLSLVTISGGEPFLRQDLPDILSALDEACHPKVIHIPTNALLPAIIESKTKQILESVNKNCLIIVCLSIDGIGQEHDKLRGIDGNFEKLIETYNRLMKLQSEYENLQIRAHGVISKFNVKSFPKTYEFVTRKLGIDMGSEIAERRVELSTMDADITPDPEDYLKVAKAMLDIMRQERSSKAQLAYRSFYYKLTSQTFIKEKQVIPCYAGFNSCHISPYGEVWPCCTLADSMSMGNLRLNDYNFNKVWFSKRAEEVRKYIRQGKCYCPLCNAYGTNVPFSLRGILNLIKEYFNIRFSR
jgi:MoaA/NifB/PqqE/SkfB family radical SAM enzyme